MAQAMAEQDFEGGGVELENHLKELQDDPSCISFSENIDESPNRKKHFKDVMQSSTSAHNEKSMSGAVYPQERL